MWQVVGQSRAVTLLQRGLEKDGLAHAYLFIGPPHVGKMTLAINLAQALNCLEAEPPCGQCLSCQKIASGKHADVQIIGLTPSPEVDEVKTRTEISIEQIRQLRHSANMPPFEGSCKAFIINGAELLSNEAANCLLKTLEEPPPRVVFILMTENIGQLPETIISRCQRLELKPIAAGEVETALASSCGTEPGKARLLAHLSHGCLGWALAAARDDNLLKQHNERMNNLIDIMQGGYEERFALAAQLATRFGQNHESVQEELDLWLDFWRDLLLVKAGFNQSITNIDLEEKLPDWAGDFTLNEVRSFIGSISTAQEQLRLNANPRLVLEVLMLDMPIVKRSQIFR